MTTTIHVGQIGPLTSNEFGEIVRKDNDCRIARMEPVRSRGKDAREERQYLAAYERAFVAVPELLEALARLCRSFPTDMDMQAIGWNGSEIAEACNAYDNARAVFKQATGGAA